MKTQITIETSDKVRAVIAMQKGDFRLATRDEVIEFFEPIFEGALTSLEEQAEAIIKAGTSVAVERATYAGTE